MPLYKLKIMGLIPDYY